MPTQTRTQTKKRAQLKKALYNATQDMLKNDKSAREYSDLFREIITTRNADIIVEVKREVAREHNTIFLW